MWKTWIVRLADGDDFGLYVSGWRNDIMTPLAFRGTLDEVLAYRRVWFG